MDNNYSLDLSIIPKELKLLLEMLDIENYYKSEIFITELVKDIDWDVFLQLAIHHRVYPIIYSKLKIIEGKLIPTHVIQTLNQEYKKNTFQMLKLSAEMEKVSELFIKNQIPTLFLKGPVLAAELYGDISLRTSKDLDILIPINALEKADKLLLSLGYEKGEFHNILNEWKWRNQHMEYFHPQKNIQLEIHWRLNPRPTKEPSFRTLWKRKRVSTVTSFPVYFLGEEDLFLYLISHGARHGWFRLRWLLDIDKIIKKGIDFDKIIFVLKKYHSFHIAGQAIILSSELLKTPINEKLRLLTVSNRSRTLAQTGVNFIKEMLPLQIITSSNIYKRYQFSLYSSYMQRIYSFMLWFYPSYFDAETLKIPKSFHFLYFPLRPFLLAWRKIRKLT
ncbi:nucleotidyltransferase family protein [Peribacillus asahii]|uniref:nucleotidyltransferase domain-containing protein n=1 Tax=Peribacillus asahii TaxID=228899 RepID=UPI00382C959C